MMRWWPDRRLPRFASLVLLWLALAGLLVDWHRSTHASRSPTPDAQRPILFLGDSLTAGEPPLGGFVEPFRKLTNLPVVDLSRPGITTGDALQQLETLKNARPQLVVVELGGHDFLKGRTRDETRAGLESIIRACRDVDADVVLMEIPRGLISDPYWGLERQLAREHDLELISDTPIRTLIFWSPFAPPGMWLPEKRLSDDGLHANQRGNEYLAQTVSRTLQRRRDPKTASPD